jgi:hypothetical protein
MQMLVVSGSYQNYQNRAVSNSMTDIGRGEYVEVTVCTVYTVLCTHHSLIVSLPKNATPKPYEVT